MVTVNYYIEDIEYGTVLLNNGTWEQFTPDVDARTFASFNDAVTHIDTINAGSYRIFSRIVNT